MLRIESPKLIWSEMLRWVAAPGALAADMLAVCAVSSEFLSAVTEPYLLNPVCTPDSPVTG